MKNISYMLASAFLLLASCHEAGVDGEGSDAMTVGFAKTAVAVYENEMQGAVDILLSETAVEDMHFRVDVCEEYNILEGEHYVLETKTPVVKAGTNRTAVVWKLTDDNRANDVRSFTLRLTEVPGASLDSTAARVKVDILDDEHQVSVGFQENVFTYTTGQQETDISNLDIPLAVVGEFSEIQLNFKVVAETGADKAIEGTDFRIPKKTLRFRGQGNYVLPIEIMNHEAAAKVKTFTIEVESVVGAYLVPASSRCTVTIENKG